MSFSKGFLSAAVAKALTPQAVSAFKNDVFLQGLAVASVGGLAATLAGGSFEHGFLAAGVAFAANQLSQNFRRINPQPGGKNGPNVTFNNDDPNKPSTDLPVDPDLAQAIEDAAVDTGFDVNVNSTTGGHASGPHVQGRAADINRINGLRVDDPANAGDVRLFQQSLIQHQNTNQVLGPILNVNKWYNAPPPSQSLINSHSDHIHVNVPR